MKLKKVHLDGYCKDNITDVLIKWDEITTRRKELLKFENKLREWIKVYLEEKGLTKYQNKKTAIKISISRFLRETVDKEMLKMMITKPQYKQVITTTTCDKMMIMTKQWRKQRATNGRYRKV